MFILELWRPVLSAARFLSLHKVKILLILQLKRIIFTTDCTEEHCAYQPSQQSVPALQSLFRINLMLTLLSILSVKLSVNLQARKAGVAEFKVDTSDFSAALVKAARCDQHFGLLTAGTVSSS